MILGALKTLSPWASKFGALKALGLGVTVFFTFRSGSSFVTRTFSRGDRDESSKASGLGVRGKGPEDLRSKGLGVGLKRSC